MIDNQMSEVFHRLCENRLFDDMSMNLTNNGRRQLLDHVITYYKLHVSGFNEMKSCEVLKTVLQ